ncbi:rod shape-determining protein [Candidatus Wirthbacteria bacterium CG2_30_54_11]|uniref:Cell shape-determining protein MreB n=1 Tax=Candidatus Wirthbacteria bacterium CG2_30_54_11 TaxID=1817892 RepID=A0A1J5IEW5_9BACT|nr:MAG: rod shape-determining protein [Candidatus Wirthbacteria bacterium CG2_30_54_11]
MANFWTNFWKQFSIDLGIDLGTANSMVYVRGHGIVIQEPSVVAISQKTKDILAIGEEAKKMVGRTPFDIHAIRPLRSGVVSDFEVTEQMLRYFIHKAVQNYARVRLFPNPRVIIGIPSGVTEVERRAVHDAALNAGARKVFLIEEPMAAAIGARLPVHDAGGCMIIDVGGGTAEIAVISLGGVVSSQSIRIAGDKLDEDIILYVRNVLNLVIGERMAEGVKISIGSAWPLKKELEAVIKGRDVLTGLPRAETISSVQVREAMTESLGIIVEAAKSTIEQTPPELVADILDRGIVLAGGGAQIRGLDTLLSQECKMPVTVAEDPMTCVVRGTGVLLDDIELLQRVSVTSKYEKVPY